MSDVSPPAVLAKSLSKTFNPGRAGQVKALTDFDLEIRTGEFISVIGPSGCGKSTFLRLVAGLTPLTKGEISVNGKTARKARKDRDYGMVFQSSGLLDWRTAARNVELPLEIMGWSKERRRERSAEMLEKVDLADFAKHYPQQLSGGMQQRVSIARALSFSPSLLLMDEPFGSLDEIIRESMQHMLRDIWREMGMTVIFVTHSVYEAVFLSTAVMVMTPRPGSVAGYIPIEFGERDARTRIDEEFAIYVKKIREILRR